MTQTVPDISPLMPMHQDPLLVNYWHAMTFLLQVNIIWMVCESSPSMRRAAGRVYHWDELSIEQGENTVRISPVISRWRELKSIPDTEELMISRYQKMISRGIIPDILISANAVPLVNIYLSNSPISQRVFPSGGQLKHRKLAHDKPGMTNNPLPVV